MVEKKEVRLAEFFEILLVKTGVSPGCAPSLVPGLGAAIIGALGSLTVYRPYFIVFAIIALVWTFFRHYGWCISRSWGEGLSAVLVCLRPSSERDAGLYIGSLLVLALIIAPPWSVTQYFKPANPCAVSYPWQKVVPAAETPRPIIQPISGDINPCDPGNRYSVR